MNENRLKVLRYENLIKNVTQLQQEMKDLTEEVELMKAKQNPSGSRRLRRRE
jgi:hypothetical protein